MTTQNIPDDAPASALFPEYDTLYDLILPEIAGLTDPQLDWSSDEWEWAHWSIRRQTSHMASLLCRWLVVRWGDTLYPDGAHGVDDVDGVAMSANDRALDVRYHDMDVILAKLREGIALAQSVLAERTAGFLRSNTLVTPYDPQDTGRAFINRAHPHGITLDAAARTETTTLEATFRHMYFEETTHLYNIQRIKRAQGLPTVAHVPPVGYWMLDGWDRSEAV